MRVSFVEIQNFRKLQSVRIDFNETTTLFVGANNSGKTSAMVALRHFLIDPHRFTTNDFTLSNWKEINRIGARWEAEAATESLPEEPAQVWETCIPILDLWLNVGSDEVHHVRSLLPTLDWKGGLLGVRLRFEPTDEETLKKEYLTAVATASNTKRTAPETEDSGKEYSLTLWPDCLRSFLDRKLRAHFKVQVYLLDPEKHNKPVGGIAAPQPLPVGSEAIEGNPLSRLIRIDEIGAQRGLGDGTDSSAEQEDHSTESRRSRRRLSEQLKSYYSKHLDPSEFPEPADLDALEAIETAQKAYDARLSHGFRDAIKELESLNYPGVSDPVLRITTRLRPVDGLNHGAALQYEVAAPGDDAESIPLTLPEEYNGLGYQNLISMVFRLMSFRDAWMLVGKASKAGPSDDNDALIPPLHLVLVEEPEAHLHVQVQQVFVRKAYDVLRNHAELRANTHLSTQMLVSTHSSHIAHECHFSWLRYFRRMPASTSCNVPTSTVINLSEVFGTEDDTQRFVTRYLQSVHCDLFFADAAILVEGVAERMLVPHFIRHNYETLHRSYVTLLEIGGSHAHRLRPLIEALGLSTLLITDVDSAEPSGHHKAACPKRGVGLISGNATLKEWHPGKTTLDELLGVAAADKVKTYDRPLFSVRVAYQIPVNIEFRGAKAEALATTFEDALVLENLLLFNKLSGSRIAATFNEAIEKAADVSNLGEALFAIVAKCDKAAFALDVLWHAEPSQLNIPTYIREGLDWLRDQLERKEAEVLATTAVAEVGTKPPDVVPTHAAPATAVKSGRPSTSSRGAK